MILPAVFTENGNFKAGLTPTVKIYDVSDNSLNQASMVDIAGGFYSYEFAARNVEKTYAFICDSVTLTYSERYSVGISEPDWKRDYCVGYVSETGLPKTGLTVFLSLYDLTNDLFVSSGNMTEIGFGFYKYPIAAMAVNSTALKRFSATNLLMPFRNGGWPDTAGIVAAERQVAAWMYSGTLVAAAVAVWERSKVYGFLGDTGLTADESWIYGIIDQPVITGQVVYPSERDVRRNVQYGPNSNLMGALRPGGGSFNMKKPPDDEEVIRMLKVFMETGNL